MNRKLCISGFQLFCMIFLFEVGTTAIVGIAHTAKQDAWISICISLIFGCLLFYVYIKLCEFYPNIIFTKYIQLILGKFIGKLLALIYIVYFIYIAARDLRDFEELMVISTYGSSSLISIGIIMMILVMYCLYKGFESFARANEFIFLLIILMIIFLIGIVVISNLLDFNNLRPVLENGLEPIIKSVFPTTITFPFGELITFTMILPLVENKKKIVKIGISGVLFSGLILIIFSIINIAVLGVSLLDRTTYPILTSISFVNVGDFLQRLDTLIIMLMVFGAFIKMTVYFYCALSGAADLFNVKKSEELIYPMSIIVILLSAWMAGNYLEHIEVGFELIPKLLHVPLQIIIPLILLIIVKIQKVLKSN
ncbi:GerAB/ArcD/ProY family transporter [Bacillus sp. AFS017336]|uniref:GerAB/ArcD/ProY family transporter n=1 Tax=Bacillus sp. AFS017336 TaxID=2033489 RepID=UPI000BF1D905|nr:GerAB/ArcD/ProY family transporter [Bacillus sp. AFS017336]PEL12681.1 spore gernimation protein KB [Bacillus sp. AFS017336]